MMLKKSVIFSIAFLVVLFCWTTNALPSRQNFNPIGQGYIVGGEVVQIEQFPYQVSVETENGKYLCGGSIISRKHVLTAAHGVEDLENGSVRVGSNTREIGGSSYKVRHVLFHENYTYNRFRAGNDIAILTLWTKFDFSKKQVRPIMLFKGTAEIPPGRRSTITGFGYSEEEGKDNKFLRAVNIFMVSREYCNSIYLGWPPIMEDRVCAGTVPGGKGACFGDGGGPLVINNQLVGIDSYCKGCGQPNIPGVFTRIAYFHDWIAKYTDS